RPIKLHSVSVGSGTGGASGGVQPTTHCGGGAGDQVPRKSPPACWLGPSAIATVSMILPPVICAEALTASRLTPPIAVVIAAASASSVATTVAFPPAPGGVIDCNAKFVSNTAQSAITFPVKVH